jgi:3-oxoisoapionate decarboxylase
MKLGINSYTFMWSIGFKGPNPAFPDREARPAAPLTPLGLLEKARELGVRVVQTGPNLPFEGLAEAQHDRFIARARDLDMELEHGTRGLDVDHVERQVALARRMGATLIRTLPEVAGSYLAEGRLIPPAVKPLLPLLESHGMKLALENGRTPAAELRAALDEIGSPLVGIVLDTANSLAVPEGWKDVARLLAPHVMCLHYKDFTIRREWHMMGFICEGSPAGRGMVEPGWLFETLQSSAHEFNVIVELWPPEQATIEETILLEQAWAAESVRFLRKHVRT